MFNRKPNWRATIVSLVSLALLATFPLSAVTASAETADHAPASVVKHVSTASTGFRMAGQDRSASSAIGESRYNRETGLWTLTAEGDITHYKHDATRAQKYKAVDSDTIPAIPKGCSGGSHVSPQGIENSGVFDGLGLDIRDNGSGPEPYGMYAVYGRSSGGASVLNEAESGVTIYHRDNRQIWYAYNLQKQGGSWKIKPQEVNWTFCSGGAASANFTPSVRSGDPTGQSSYNYTFDRAGTDFTSGAVVPHSVDGIGGTYIFGGPADSYQKGKPEKIIKLFAFQTGSNGSGVVKYLGFIPTGNAPHNFNGDFTFDKQGNLYVSAAKITQNDAANPEVRVFKVPVANLKNAISGGFRQFSFNGRNHWGNGGSDSFGFYSSKAHSGSFRCSGVGGTDRGSCFAREVNSQEVYRKTIKPTTSTRYDWFAGVDISPDKNLTVGVAGTANSGSAIPVIIEVDNKGEEVGKVDSFYNTYSNSQISSDVPGAVHSRRLTDFVGSLWAATKPAQPRYLTLSKKVENRVGNDQFQVDLNPIKAYASHTEYAINHDGSITNFTRTDEEQKIGERTQIPSTEFKARIGERLFRNGNRFDIRKSYSTTLKCYNSVGAQLGSGVFKIDEDTYHPGSQNRYFDITLGASVTGEISCKLVNTGPKPTTPSTPTAQVTVYKNFKSFHDDSDTFTVGLRHNQQEYKSDTTTQYVANDTYFYPMASGVSVPAGDTITVFEKNLTGSVSDYDVDMSCYHGTIQNRGSAITGTPRDVTNGKELQVTIPQQLTNSKQIFCIVKNANKVNEKTIRVHKWFDRRYKDNDNFKVSAYTTDPYYTHVDISTTGSGTESANVDISSANNPDESLRDIKVPIDATLTVDEVGIRDSYFDPNVMAGYNAEISCRTNSGKVLVANQDQGQQQTRKSFDLSQTTDKQIDCYVKNTALTVAPKTVHLHKKFTGFVKDTDRFQLSLSRPTTVSAPKDSKSATTENLKVGEEPDLVKLQVYPTSQVSISESPVANTNTNISKYNATLACYNGEGRDPLTKLETTGSSSSWKLNVTEHNDSDIHCYLDNSPKDARTVTVKKVFENTSNTNGFKINGYVTDDYFTEANKFEVADTAGNTVGQAFNVTKQPKTIPNGTVNIHLHENVLNSFVGVNLANYKISAVCADKHGHSANSNNTKPNGDNWDYTARITNEFKGEITCTITNKLVNKKIKVVLYKQLHRFNSTDQFTVGLYDPQTNPESSVSKPINTGTATVADKLHFGNPAVDYDQYVVAEHDFTQSDNGFKLRVKEWPANGNSANLSNYNLNLFCQHYDFDNPGWKDIDGIQLENEQHPDNGISVDVPIPADKNGLVHCYLQNKATPKVKVVLYKDLKRADTTDQFTVGMSKPGATGDTSTPVISPVQANNSNLTETSYYQKPSDDYQRYQIGSYEYARDDKTGFNFKVEETANAGGVLDKYTSNLTCKYVSNGSESTDAVASVDATQPDTGRTRSISGVIPAGSTDAVVHCYLTNNPKPNTKVVLFKQVKKVKDGDDFSITLRPTYSTEYYAALGNYKDFQIKKSTADVAAEDKRVVNDGSGNELYTEYKIGEFPARPAGLDYKFEISETRSGSEVHLNDYVSKFTCKRVVNGVEQENPVFLVKTDYTKDSSDSTRKFAGMVIPQTETREVHCYLRNDPKPKGSITIHKVSKTSGLDLAGSEWKICKKDASPAECFSVADNVKTGVVADGTPGKVADADKNPGFIKIQGLSLGTYTITETKAPVGFLITGGIQDVTIDEAHLDKTISVENVQATVPVLPLTGGWGTLPYMILGFVLTGGAVVAFVIAKPKKKN